ncbi:monooxygenase [Streptomyces sp. XY431]|uniref:MupA/Atu3671 family FMN-dependent luciferase-like monooxygenase n=1 Tax=Streptomyces sp. XY431 TaxID=1415562 RepID=UPI0006AF50BA|nr:MupA/Atu3671 family FMN-dependent luciferase-like monooxygenase [Streptomyces sp. XY431]KOV35582.1 monooxygenase [Streptomyces sp. XY431]
MQLSLSYFAAEEGSAADAYRLLLEGARFADREGLTAVWTPERHFHPFGGLYPNPAVTAAALAAATDRIRIRAGSVVLPLHDPIRVAEEWAFVDNISGGRVDVSFASGWHSRDFVLAPDDYADRRQLTEDRIAEVRRLWAGGTVTRRDGSGQDSEITVYPRPVQAELPVWLTSSGNPDTFAAAGRLGAGLLTHLLGQDLDTLAERIGLYREAYRASPLGDGGDGHVTLMLHTFLGDDVDRVRAAVRGPMSRYLRSSLHLTGLLARPGGRMPDLSRLSERDLDFLVGQAFERYFDRHGLFGTVETATALAERLAGTGVDEIACLIDFGVPTDEVLASLPRLAELARAVAG